MAEQWSSTKTGVFKWCKGEEQQRVALVQKPDGHLTGNASEVDELLRKARLPVFQMYTDKPEPSWDAFEKRFGKHIPTCQNLCLEPLTVGELRRVLSRMKSSSSPGPDGWRVSELKALPDSLLERLASLLNVIEQTGCWPDALAQGVISLISKGEGSEPNKLRPISVMSVIYRLWVAARLKHIMLWQESWIDDCLHGFRLAHSPADAWWPLALKIEHALLFGEDLSGIALDYSKCFDRVPIDIVFKLARCIGMPWQILTPLRSMYANLKRRFVFAGAIGKSFVSTNGILQGCPLSIIMLNLLVNVWVKAVKSEVPDANPYGFADDTGATAHGTNGHITLQSVMDLTGEYAALTGQALNVDKSAAWATTTAAQSNVQLIKLNGKGMKFVRRKRVLGAHLCFDRHCLENDVARKACEEAIVIAKRIQWTPLSMFERAQLVSSLCNPRALYSYPCLGGSRVQMNSLRSSCVNAFWGAGRKLRAREIVCTLLVKGHRVDPCQYATNSCFQMARRQLASEELGDTFVRVWKAYADGAVRAPGPIGVLWSEIKQIGWSWSEPWCLERPGRPRLHLLWGPDGWWGHQIRDGMRGAEWLSVSRKRKDCVGLDIPGGVDKDATCAVLNSNSTACIQRGCLRSILSGSVRLGERLFRANIWNTPICIFCGQEEETNEHCFWRCPAWDHLRLDPDLPSFHERIALPPCTLQCGIFMRTQEELDYESSLQPIEHERSAEVPLSFVVNETFVDGAVIIWTDGACPRNQCRALRRAGCGIYYGQDHPRNKSFALRGSEQTNNRAELLACVVALEGESRPMQIRTDSQYVIDGVEARRSRGDNNDLWKLMHSTLDHRGPNTYKFVKVRGHAKDIHVRAGLVEPIDKVGNDAADSLAVQGAASHALPEYIVKRCIDRMTRAKSCHRMMLKILDARRRAEQVLKGEVVDEFMADIGDDPWSEPSMNMPMYVPHPRSGEG